MSFFFLNVASPLLMTPSPFGEGLEEDLLSTLVTPRQSSREPRLPSIKGSPSEKWLGLGIGAQDQTLHSESFPQYRYILVGCPSNSFLRTPWPLATASNAGGAQPSIPTPSHQTAYREEWPVKPVKNASVSPLPPAFLSSLTKGGGALGPLEGCGGQRRVKVAQDKSTSKLPSPQALGSPSLHRAKEALASRCH